MADRFEAELAPMPSLIERLSRQAPENPFCTPSYASTRATGGADPCVLQLTGEDRTSTGCLAFMSTGRVSRTLEIDSLPALPPETVFWDELIDWCRTAGVTELVLNSYGSPSARIPALGPELWRRSRREYLLELGHDVPGDGMSSNHRRNVRRAEKVGANLRRAQDMEACRAHAALISASMNRRRARGEDVPLSSDPLSYRSYTETGAGEIFQVWIDDTVVSSMLVLRSPQGAYYHSAGTSPDGMSIGTSHFLISRISETLYTESTKTFNLGGAAPEQAGLARFKLGFGAREVQLEAATFSLRSFLTRYVISAIRRLLPSTG